MLSPKMSRYHGSVIGASYGCSTLISCECVNTALSHKRWPELDSWYRNEHVWRLYITPVSDNRTPDVFAVSNYGDRSLFQVFTSVSKGSIVFHRVVTVARVSLAITSRVFISSQSDRRPAAQRHGMHRETHFRWTQRAARHRWVVLMTSAGDRIFIRSRCQNDTISQAKRGTNVV